MEEITIPGTNTKIPVVLGLGAALVIAVIVILRRGGDESEQAGNLGGLLAAELDQRLREQWEATVRLIAEAMEEVGQSDPITPPGTPVDPGPKTPSPDGESYKELFDSPLKVVYEGIIIGGPVKVGQSNPISLPAASINPKISYTSSESYNETVGGLPKVVYTESSSVGEVGQSNPVSAPVTSIKPKMPTLHAGGASLYTLGSYDLL